MAEEHAGIAIAIKKNIVCQIIDDIPGNILAVKVDTARGPVTIATTGSVVSGNENK